ncbi:MAG: hypothetical protein LBB51_02690 [Zoogloeaceae bacterium]|jgi:hypothetical protein|nr:hypothetical protein [Zoogloeaceae bacterium]
MDFLEFSLRDRVALYLLQALLVAPDTRKIMSHKTLIHEARQIAEVFVSTAEASEYEKMGANY